MIQHLAQFIQFGRGRIRHQLRGLGLQQDRAHRLAHFMGDGGCQFAHHRQALGTDQGMAHVFGTLEFGDIQCRADIAAEVAPGIILRIPLLRIQR